MAILVEPDRIIQARVSWKNGGVLPFASQLRLSLRNSDWLATWNEGEWITSHSVNPGATGIATVTNQLPSNWEGKLIDVRVEAQNGRSLVLDEKQDYFYCVKSKFEWAADGYYERNSYWDTWWACAKRSCRHKGKAVHVWIGFAILPTYWDEAQGKFVFPSPNMVWGDPNSGPNPYYGSDIWKGHWSDWGDDAKWSLWYEQWAAEEGWCNFWPAGYTAGFYGPLWVVQTQSPTDRRDAGLAPMTYEFDAHSWDMVRWVVG